MGWSTVLKTFGKWGLRGGKAAAESVGSAVVHPQRTLKGLGTATKTAVAGGAAAYVGWEKITTDKSVARIVGDAIIGESAIDGIETKMDGMSDSMSSMKESVGNTMDAMRDGVSHLDEKWNGVSDLLSGIASGEGGHMMGSFLGNLTHGNVSGLGITGLILSALLLFGRFGWLGKIAGAMLGMMVVGNNTGIRNERSNTGTLLSQESNSEQIPQIHRSR